MIRYLKRISIGSPTFSNKPSTTRSTKLASDQCHHHPNATPYKSLTPLFENIVIFLANK